MYADHGLLGRKYVPGQCNGPECLVTSYGDRKDDATGNILTSVYLREEKGSKIFGTRKNSMENSTDLKKIHNYIKYTDFCKWIIKSMLY